MVVNVVETAWLHSLPSLSALHLQLDLLFMKAIWMSCPVSRSYSRGQCFYFSLRCSTSTKLSQTEKTKFLALGEDATSKMPLEKMPLQKMPLEKMPLLRCHWRRCRCRRCHWRRCHF